MIVKAGRTSTVALTVYTIFGVDNLTLRMRFRSCVFTIFRDFATFTQRFYVSDCQCIVFVTHIFAAVALLNFVSYFSWNALQLM